MASWGGVVPNEKRVGVMLHYDASTSDAGGIAWLKSPECKVSYNWAVRDDGTAVAIAPENCRAYHAGVCKPSSDVFTYTDANSAFYGVALTAKAGDKVTPAQFETVLTICRRLFESHGWPLRDTWRITGHAAEAWPRGRKVDPDPVLSPQTVRDAL